MLLRREEGADEQDPRRSTVAPGDAIAGRQGRVYRVKAIGRIVPEVNKKAKPIQSGFSVGHVKITAGTVGAIVTKGKKLYILSNSHVLADSGLGAIGDSVLYPGPHDGGKLPQNLAGTLAKFVKFKVGGQFVNRVDAALCAIDSGRLADVNTAIFGVKGLPGTIKAERDMIVMKRGRTTGETKARLKTSTSASRSTMAASVGGLLRAGALYVVPKGGDSGSIIVDKKSRKIVGLHFAGSNGGSVFNPIGDVIKALGFKFVT